MTPKFDKVPLVSRIYRFGGFELDEIDETLKRGSEVININRRMFEVLRLLIRNAGRVVSKDEFFRDVWGGRFVEDNNLTVTITALRKVLGDSAKEARFIENLPRKVTDLLPMSKVVPITSLSRSLSPRKPFILPDAKSHIRPLPFVVSSFQGSRRLRHF